MPTDKHFNEQAGMPEPLEDHQPTDMPATRTMFVVLAIVAFLGLVVLATLQFTG
ncbi:MAG: hypothetical protein IPK99_05595 [Flavobacteriales bacterium]|nr:hypothetical protein [Flavobacteriales bacterium]